MLNCIFGGGPFDMCLQFLMFWMRKLGEAGFDELMCFCFYLQDSQSPHCCKVSQVRLYVMNRIKPAKGAPPQSLKMSYRKNKTDGWRVFLLSGF